MIVLDSEIRAAFGDREEELGVFVLRAWTCGEFSRLSCAWVGIAWGQ